MPRPPRIALFGGSFDPVHLGHLHIAKAALDRFELDQVIFIPCRQSPHKEDGTVASEEQRLHMLRLATEDRPWAEVSEVEMLLPPPSFSWITAEAMREVYPEARLFWLMGADQWSVIETWARSDYLAQLVEFIVHDRDDGLAEHQGFRAHFLAGHHPASASTIRDSAADALRSDWLPENVEQFIRHAGLYGCSP